MAQGAVSTFTTVPDRIFLAFYFNKNNLLGENILLKLPCSARPCRTNSNFLKTFETVKPCCCWRLSSFTGNCTSRKVSLFSHLAPKYPRCRLKVRSFSCVALSSNIDSFISRWLGWSPVCVLLVGEDRFSRSCATTISAPAGQKHENILTFSVLRPEPQQLPPAPSPAGRALRRAADARGWFHISSHLQHFNLFRFLVS